MHWVKRPFFLVAIFFCLVLAFGQFSGGLVFNVSFSSANKSVSKFNFQVSSNLLSWHIGDLVYFKNESTNNYNYGRVLATSGDSVEIKDGFVLRNGFIADNPDLITFTYFSRKKNIKLKEFHWLEIPPSLHGDTTFFHLNYDEYKKVSRQYLLRLAPISCYQTPVFAIPAGNAMVLSDNRSIPNNLKCQQVIFNKQISGKVILHIYI